MKLNDPQIRAASHVHGPMLVLAGPGSGKTSVILQRLNNLIYEQGVFPDKILTVTFSRAAAQELSRRFNETAVGAGPVFGTFHSVFYNILRCSSSSFTHPAVISAGQKSQFIKTGIERMGIEVLDEAEFLSDVYSCISAALTGETGYISRVPQGMNARSFSEFLGAYMKYKADNSLLDFDDMLIECKRLLLSDNDILRFWQHRFDYIMVDEFQDINQIQYDIIGLLAGEHQNLFVVGDDDQSIYGFRGAKPGIMKSFLKDHPDAELVRLSVNYRSGEEIIWAGSKVISANKNRIEKNIVPACSEKSAEDAGPAQTQSCEKTYAHCAENPGTGKINGPEPDKAGRPMPEGVLYAGNVPNAAKGRRRPPEAAVTVRSFQSRAEECRHITEILRERQHGGKGLSSAAVLFRNNADAGMLLNMLDDNMIKYKFSGKVQDVREHFIFKDMLSYLHLAEGFPSKIERSDLLRIINRPVRYISRESLARADVCAGPSANLNRGGDFAVSGHRPPDYFLMMRRFYAGNSRMLTRLSAFEADIRTLKGLAPYAAFQYIWKVIGYETHIREYAQERRADFGALEGKYREMLELAESFDTSASFLEYTGKRRDKSAFDPDAEPGYAKAAGAPGGAGAAKAQARDDAVNIMTMHASKGLEFELVILPCVNDSIIPGRSVKGRDEIEEERRILYVAMTRAKKTLMISYVDKLRGISAQPSRFIRCLM